MHYTVQRFEVLGEALPGDVQSAFDGADRGLERLAHLRERLGLGSKRLEGFSDRACQAAPDRLALAPPARS